MSGSLDPFEPFHRRFTRLHNAATLIKINYTLARQFALLSLSLLLSPGPALAVLAHPLVFSPPPPSQLPPSFLSANFFFALTLSLFCTALSTTTRVTPPLPPSCSLALPPLSFPLARLFALYSRFNLPTSGDSLVGARSTL